MHTEGIDPVAVYRSGEDGALNFLMDQMMQATGGNADSGTGNELLRERIDG